MADAARQADRRRLLGAPLRAQARRAERPAAVRAAAAADPARGPRSRACRSSSRSTSRARPARQGAAQERLLQEAAAPTRSSTPSTTTRGSRAARASSTAPIELHRDRPRALLRAKTKRSASGKIKRKTKDKKKTELAVTVSLPKRNYAAAGEVAIQRSTRKESVRAGEDRTVVKLSRVVAARAHGRGARRRAAARAAGRRLRARRPVAEEEAVSARRHRHVLVQARVLHAARLHQHGGRRRCTACSRRICDKHLAEGGLCVECAAKRDEESAFADPDARPRSATARAGTSGAATRPMWWGTNDPYYYDTLDYRWYDSDDFQR